MVAVYLKSKSKNISNNVNTDITMANSKDYPRGYRNNNPLNIDKSNEPWKGKITPSGDSRFEQFISMPYGYRAALINIRTYVTKYGLNTIEGIISRWAPQSENNTQGYIRSVCNTTGYTPSTIIDPYNQEQMCNLVYAMAIVENGTKYMPDMEQIKAGWRLI